MRVALAGAPAAVPGAFEWRTIDQGFEIADLPVMTDGRDVDHILLARSIGSRGSYWTRPSV
jgi:hypothetical protein